MINIRYVFFAALFTVLAGCATTPGTAALQTDSGDAPTVFKSPPVEMHESNYSGS